VAGGVPTRFAADVQSKAPFADEVIAASLYDGWGLSPVDLDYSMVGYGSWHWHARCEDDRLLFVTVDEVGVVGDLWATTKASHTELAWAYEVPLAVDRAGMTFARPPIPSASGSVLAPICDGWVVSVWPLIEGRSTHDGTHASQDDASAVVAALGVLHDLPVLTFDSSTPRFETFRVPGLDRLLSLLDVAWPTPVVGPLAAAAEDLLHRHAKDIRALARLHEDLVIQAPSSAEWVLTHGEPHAANVVFTSAGPVLIDWDTTMVAPKERDLWMIAADGFSVGDVSPELIRLYRAQWDLSELWEYARRFANPNDDGPEGDGAWDDFTQYVRRAAHI
jgi:hypothetical protein